MPESASTTASRGVFLSYAHEDAPAVQRIADALRAAGVEVWFDQSELRGGDAWDANIRGQIESCALFVPIVSIHTQARREGYFRLEWNLADERTHLMAAGTPFLLPVAIDDTKDRGALVPKSFLGVQWMRLPGGEPSAALVQRVQSLLGTSSPQEQSRSPLAPRDEGVASPESQARRAIPLWASVGVGMAVVAFAAYLLLRAPATPVPAASVAAKPPAAQAAVNAKSKSIAVLPFVNRSTDKENEFFTDGMHDDILTHLSRIRELHVTSRTSVEQYRNTKKTLKQVGEELGVTYVLEGSVQRAGNKVRVTGQLIRAATDDHLWAQNYDRDLTDIFALQSELAQAIAAELKAAISPEEKKLIEKRPTENLAAYDLYLKARASRDVLEGPDKRVTLLKAAVQVDPAFAAAWALLGESYAQIARRDFNGAAAHAASAKAAIEHAARLAPDAPETLIAQARYLTWVEKDYSRAIPLLERVLSQSPNDAIAYASLSNTARFQGRPSDALKYIRKAISLDAGNLNHLTSVIQQLAAGRRYDDERVERQKLAKLRPPSLTASYEIALISFKASGAKREVERFLEGLTEAEAKSEEALRWKRDWSMRSGDLAGFIRLAEASPRVRRREVAWAIAAQGDIAAARAKLGNTSYYRTAVEREPANPYWWVAWSQDEAFLGNKEEALRSAKKAMELKPESVDASTGPPYRANLAHVYAWIGEKDRAIAEYARLLQTPWSGLNVHEMKHHPAYAPLRGDPRFQALLNDPKNNAPLF